MFEKVDYYFNKLVEYRDGIIGINDTYCFWVVFSRYFSTGHRLGERSASCAWYGSVEHGLGVRDNRHISIEIIKNPSSWPYEYIKILAQSSDIYIFAFMIVEGMKMVKAVTKTIARLKLNRDFYTPCTLAGVVMAYFTLTSLNEKHREWGLGDMNTAATFAIGEFCFIGINKDAHSFSLGDFLHNNSILSKHSHGYDSPGHGVDKPFTACNTILHYGWEIMGQEESQGISLIFQIYLWDIYVEVWPWLIY